MKRYLFVGIVNFLILNVKPPWTWEWIGIVVSGIVAGAIDGGKHQTFTSVCLMVAPIESFFRWRHGDPLELLVAWGIYFALAKLGSWGRMAVSKQGRPARSF